ncbi:TlpA disulfide reductase family protein [Butyricimonas sp.]|uniref:TlpA family protein disulfide reductase n=1 Tax=Butyricimonas sp. TaxID=1969738 RepID=UPI0025C30280|nr:TlpA disulfide reductase family protein [Butyricimonas sp.]
MRKLFIALLIAFVFGACQTKKEVAVDVVVKDKAYEGAGFYLSKMDTVLQLNAEGKGSVILTVDEPQYAVFQYKWKNVPVYLEPGKNLSVTWDMTPSGLMVSFDGEGGVKSNFINGNELDIPKMGDFGLPEDEFLAKLDQYMEDNYKALESKGFDKNFVEKEKYRIRYNVNGIMWQYARRGNPSDEFYNKMKSMMEEQEWLLQLSGYTNYMQGVIEVLSNRGVDLMNAPDEEIVMNELNYVLQNIKNPKIKEYLVGSFAIDYIDREGISKADGVKKIFEETVTDPLIKQAFAKIYEEGTSITKGNKAPDFKYLDINGKEVKLSDLKGNLVYIDIWATWCGPCREEIPHLQKLEEAFKGTKVRFVSISTDKDKAKWEETVKGEKLGGIQLHTGGDEAFTSAFRVKGIPHFILIDPEGRILEANMSRPSESKTVEYLSMYAEPEE